LLTHRRILILGPVDSGKSHLFRRIIELWGRRGYRFSALDLDVGQSTLGLPTTINCLCGRVHRFFFYGFTSPRVSPLRFLAGLSRLNRGGRLVADTTGYVEVPHGLELKANIMEVLRPDLVIAFSLKEPHWQAYLRSLSCRVIFSEKSPQARRRGPAEREKYREGKFHAYFRETERGVVTRKNLVPIRPGYSPSPGNLVSFRRDGMDLFLGWIEEVGEREVVVSYPAGRKPTEEVIFSYYNMYYNIKRAKQLSLFEGGENEGLD